MVEMNSQDQEALKEKLKNMSPEELKEFQKKNCIFCQIISGKVPSQSIYQDEKSFAVLDINPANKGHILLLPKEHNAIMPQMTEEDIAHLFTIAKYLSQAQLKAFKAQGSTIFVANGLAAGQRAQHFMIHIIPRFENDNLSILNIPQKQVPESDLEKLREVLIKKINEVFKLKKETYLEKKKEPEPTPEPEEKEPEGQLKIPKKEEPEPLPVIGGEPEEKEIEEVKEPAPDPKIKKQKKANKKTKKPKEEEKEEASLDDIAGLFQ